VANFCTLFFGEQFHHLYYLLPYIEESLEKEVLYIDREPFMLHKIKEFFPNINPVFISESNPEGIINYLSKFSVILLSNNYTYLIKLIFPKLLHSYITSYIVHGTPQKFIKERSYMRSLWSLNDVTVFPGFKDLLQLFELNNLDFKKLSDSIRFTREGKTTLLLKSGSLRMKNYLTNKNQKILEIIKEQIETSKLTLLYMPTFNNKFINSEEEEYSSIEFFLELFNKMKRPFDFNWIIKVHPNVVSSNSSLWRSLLDLKEENEKEGINIILEAYQDYLPFMDVADALISDRTTAAFEFLYFNKPIFFLDNTGTCPHKIDFYKDIMSSFWLYQAGNIIRREDLSNIDNILHSFIKQDSYKEIRDQCKKFSFEDKYTASDILKELFEYHSSLFIN
jgi:hypothetical protein